MIDNSDEFQKIKIAKLKILNGDAYMRLFSCLLYKYEIELINAPQGCGLNTAFVTFNKNKNKFEKSTIIKLLKHYNSFKNFKYFGFNAVEILQDKYDVFLKDLKNGKIGNKYEITNYIDWYGLYYDKFK